MLSEGKASVLALQALGVFECGGWIAVCDGGLGGLGTSKGWG